jgi:phospholipase C
MFGLNPLTSRDASANPLNPNLFTLTAPRTDCPVKLTSPSLAMKIKREPRTADEEASLMNQPLPESGNLIGFLHIMMKAEFELAGKTEAAETGILENFKEVKTRGQAKEYILKIQSRIEEARAMRK